MGKRQGHILVSPSSNLFLPGFFPFDTHLASCGYRDNTEMLTQAPNSSMVATPAGSKDLELPEDSRDQGSFPKISQELSPIPLAAGTQRHPSHVGVGDLLVIHTEMEHHGGFSSAQRQSGGRVNLQPW